MGIPIEQQSLTPQYCEHREPGDTGLHVNTELAALSLMSPELLQRWHARRKEALESLNGALPMQDAGSERLNELARLMHQLAGTAAMFGEGMLGEYAAQLEGAIRSESPPAKCEDIARQLLAAA